MSTEIEEFEKLIEEAPENPKPYYFLAITYINNNNLDMAIETLEKGIKNTKAQGELHSLLGVLLFSKEEYEKALGLLLEAEKLSPSPAQELYNAIGETYFKLKEYDKAGLNFLKMLKSDRENIDILFYAADCYRLSLKWNAAEMLINRALKINYEDVRFHNMLAFLSIMRFNFQRAFKIYQKIMEINEKHKPQALFNTGFTCMVMGNYDETIKIWKELTEKYPHRTDFFYSLAFIYFICRNKEESLKYFNLCIKADPFGKLALKARERIEEVNKLLD